MGLQGDPRGPWLGSCASGGRRGLRPGGALCTYVRPTWAAEAKALRVSIWG